MSASVGSDGGCRSPGRHWMKSLKTAACFHTSSSSLPSMTGGLSKRGTRTGFTFSAVRNAANLAAAFAGSATCGFALPADGADPAGLEFVAAPSPEARALAGVEAAGVGVGVGPPSVLPLPEGGLSDAPPLAAFCSLADTHDDALECPRRRAGSPSCGRAVRGELLRRRGARQERHRQGEGEKGGDVQDFLPHDRSND